MSDSSTIPPRQIQAAVLFPCDSPATLRPGLLLRDGKPILLRSTMDANVWLGCLSDGGGQIHDWYEIWEQRVDPSLHPAGYVTNAWLDARWQQRLHLWSTLPKGGLIQQPEADQPRPPVQLNGDSSSPQPLAFARDPAATPALCREDKLLLEAGLPPFSTSLHRYLMVGQDETRHFVPVTRDAPVSAKTLPFEEAFGEQRGVVFNRQGGYVCLRRLAPLALGEFSDLLSGGSWKNLGRAGDPVLPDAVYQSFGDASLMGEGGGHLFLGRRGVAARLTESLYLKLQLLADLFHLTRAMVRQTQLPFLDLDPTAFRIRLAAQGHLPWLWTACVEPARAPDCVLLPVASDETRYFQYPGQRTRSIYSPDIATNSISGHGSLRLRGLERQSDGRVVVEGTLTAKESLEATVSDLIVLRLPLAEGGLPVSGQVSSRESLAGGELRFRGFPLSCSDAEWRGLRQAEGVPLQQVPYELIPVLRTPVDLYSLGVIALEILLAGESGSLPLRLDACLSLARRVLNGDPAQPLPDRIRECFEEEPRFQATLGPQNLCGVLADGTLADALPPGLWADVLAWVVRCFPGIGPESYCADFGAVSPFALETAFDEPCRDLSRIHGQARSLLLLDWGQNREVRQVIDAYRPRN